MYALEFLLNGKRICVAAPSNDGIVLANVAMFSLSELPGVCDVEFRVGGVANDKHLEWNRQSLALGDLIEIRIVDVLQSDPPVATEPITDDQRERLRIASRDY